VTRATFRSDLFSLASMAFSGGIAFMVAVSYLIRGNGLGWAFAVSAMIFVAAAIIVGRRSLNRLELEKDPVS
jgi:membrane protein implicated in regulation of membrane protease activity